ncbi:hypothetical protein LZ31DRAFT_48867 [Colletotrichum somersetense]|nr:hypothetical protein LZ31DRAFT_48867 [Colletotrichum somersetense]
MATAQGFQAKMQTDSGLGEADRPSRWCNRARLYSPHRADTHIRAHTIYAFTAAAAVQKGENARSHRRPDTIPLQNLGASRSSSAHNAAQSYAGRPTLAPSFCSVFPFPAKSLPNSPRCHILIRYDVPVFDRLVHHLGPAGFAKLVGCLALSLLPEPFPYAPALHRLISKLCICIPRVPFPLARVAAPTAGHSPAGVRC